MTPPGVAVLRLQYLAFAGAGIFVSARGGQLGLDCASRVVVVGTAGDLLGCSKDPDIPRLTCLAGVIADLALAVWAEPAPAFALCEASAGFLRFGGEEGFDLVLEGGAAVAGVGCSEDMTAGVDCLCDAHGLGIWEGMVAVGWCWLSLVGAGERC